MKPFVYFEPTARLGNTLYQASAAMAYALEHNLRFSMPSETTNAVWKPTYLQHLVDPELNPNLPNVVIKEKQWTYHELPYKPEKWGRHFQGSYNIQIGGYRQSVKYFEKYRDEIIKRFGFPWKLRSGIVGVHLRRGDYLIHTDKHPAVPKEWYLAQMAKFPNQLFHFCSDDIEWCRENFAHEPGCWSAFERPFSNLPDSRPEVIDLVMLSQCEHVIGSASTFAVWAGMLGRNPGRRVIIPREWIKEGWQSTTAKDWADICPTSEGWERA